MSIDNFFDWLPGSLIFSPATPSDELLKEYL